MFNSNQDARAEFARFRAEHGRQYHTPQEAERRFLIFRDNLRRYEEHNLAGASWTMGGCGYPVL